MIDQLRTSGLRNDEEESASFVMTPDGWEPADYIEPGEDWLPLSDGSYESPDGTVRSYPEANPAGA